MGVKLNLKTDEAAAADHSGRRSCHRRTGNGGYSLHWSDLATFGW